MGSPVEVDGDIVHIDTVKMTELKPYPFVYRGKKQLAILSQDRGTVTIYEVPPKNLLDSLGEVRSV